EFLLGIAMKAIITTGISAIGLWFGTIGAKYNPKNPQQRLKFSTSLLLQLLSVIYLFVAFIPYTLLILPVEMIDFVAEIQAQANSFFDAILHFVYVVLKWRTEFPVLMGITGTVILLLVPIAIATLFTLASGRKLDKGIEITQVYHTQSKGLFSGKGGLR